MKNWQFFIICGLLVSISRNFSEGIQGNVMGMIAGLLMGLGIFLWWTTKSDKTKE